MERDLKGKALLFLPLAVALILIVGFASYNDRSKSKLSTETSSFTEIIPIKSTTTCNSCPSSNMSEYCMQSSPPVSGGMDFVQYFTDFKNSDGTYDETKVGSVGNVKYSSTFNDYTFYFLSQTNKDLFDISPSSYIPQYGGFCTWGVTGEFCPNWPWSATCMGPEGNWASWTIQNNKLYLFKNNTPKEKFLENVDMYITIGDERWLSWYGDEYENRFSTLCYTKSLLLE